MMSCSVEGRQSENRGTSFIIRLVVHLKALLRRALWRRVMVALSCSLATSTWTARTTWRFGCGKGVAVGAPAVGGEMVLGVLVPSQMFLNWKPRAMGGHWGLTDARCPPKVQ